GPPRRSRVPARRLHAAASRRPSRRRRPSCRGRGSCRGVPSDHLSFVDERTGSRSVHKKRQSRRTRGFIGFGSRSIWPSREPSQVEMATKKRARCAFPPSVRRPSVPYRARVAKKVRTPPPPRRVQAPQKRETRRAAGIPTRPPWFYAALGAGAVALIAAIVIGVILVRGSGGSSKSSKSQANVAGYNRLPG